MVEPSAAITLPPAAAPFRGQECPPIPPFSGSELAALVSCHS
jgi:hypothetical protein